MKKIKQPGDNFSLKTKKSEDPLVMQWINTQTNLMDSIRYLIENEIRSNGVRNLQAIIPTERSGLPSSPSFSQASASTIPPAASHETAAAHEPEPADEEEFDDEDIEAWI
ncbi:hypothetical protein E5161_11330 [Cohnella pontilimi]|uniref:Uncharacterized protein n=1 Tax=Cohnella pontilimi TaxID=2564100 RepID=A0A4U0FAT6_9BACL|nr:hypothetical protein [Cohnella pontilimi]TJY41790.1 hypothetical protein E5161_11330 [Cohnella pontilimi]